MVIKGENLMTFVGEGANAVSIAYATNHTMNINLSTTETSNKDQGHGEFQTFEGGVLSWDCSSDNLVGDANSHGKTYSDMVDLMLAKTPVTLVFGINNPNTTPTEEENGTINEAPTAGWTANDTKMPYYTGKALITSISCNAPNGDNASYSVSFQGTGPIKKKTV